MQLKVGQSTPEELQRGMLDVPDVASWGQRNYDKSPSVLFRFEDGRLVLQESVVHEDR